MDTLLGKEDVEEKRDTNGGIKSLRKGDQSSTSASQPTTLEPFKMEVRLDILVYCGEIDPKELNGWLKKLEVYFSTKDYIEDQRINFAKLKLGDHALTW